MVITHMLSLIPLSPVFAFAVTQDDGYTAANDAALAQRARQSPETFSELYHRHLPGVYRYHLARTGNVQEAEDLTAQTFLAAIEAIGTYRQQGSFSAWLFGIARHKLHDHYRQRKPDLPLEAAQDVRSPLPLPEETALQHSEIRQVAQALRLISPERAEALVLCLFGGFSLPEASQALGKSEAAVKMLVYRGVSDLQGRLAAHQEMA